MTNCIQSKLSEVDQKYISDTEVVSSIGIIFRSFSFIFQFTSYFLIKATSLVEFCLSGTFMSYRVTIPNVEISFYLNIRIL